jgi:type I restriction enzyme S subunit
MKAYPKYKDSGVEWISRIPDSWNAFKIRRFSQVKRGASPRPIGDSKYFDDKGEFAWVRIADVSASDRYLKRTSQTLSELGASLSVKRYPNDLFLSIAGTVGKPIITKIKCCIHDGFVWFPELKMNPEYLYYIFYTGLPYQGLGKWGTQQNLNTDTVADIYIPLPSKKEVDKIISYLDHKTAQIDTLVEKKKRLIELLKEERTAVINQAVTKGLDPNVPMKESGIEWLGEIPEHWEVKRLKYLSNIRYGLSLPPKQKKDGIPMIRATNVMRGRIVSDNLIFVDPENIPYDRNPILKKDEIIVVRSGAYTADSAIVSDNYVGAIIGYDLVLNVKYGEPKFIAYTLLSTYVLYNQLYLLRLRAAQPHLNAEELGESLIVIPPENSEQKDIVIHIKKQTTRIDTLITKTEKQINLLQEYRTALISEVVTGKIDVRDWEEPK